MWNVTLGDSPPKGPKDALVTVVMFSDFQCPFCKRIEPTFAQLEKEYGNKIRFVWKNQPLSFHNRAIPTAIAAWEVKKQKGDEGFWKMHDELFASQPKLEDADIEGIAKKLGSTGPRRRRRSRPTSGRKRSRSTSIRPRS